MPATLVKIDEIEISSNRQRRAFDEGKHVELCDSIQNPAIGLMHPVVIRAVGGKKVLVAGERRLRAFKDSADLGVQVFHAGVVVPPGYIPTTLLGELDELDAWEAELEENIRRVDLTWQERANATQELMMLRVQQATKKGVEAPSVASISTEVRGRADGGFQSDTRAELIVSRHLDDPDVAAAPNLRQAMKVLVRKEEKRKNEATAAQIGLSFSSASHTLENADSAEWIKGVPDESFDVVVTDPPYGMGADDFGDSGGMAQGNHGYTDSAQILTNILLWFPEQSFRIAKPDSHIYVFCDVDWFPMWKQWMGDAGWKVFRTPLIWAKPNAFRAPWPDMGPQRRYEMILYAVKGNRHTQKLGGDVMSFPSDDNLGHAAQKPVALYKELLSRSAVPGDRVLDLFCGTGPIFPAAHALKLYATGVEMDAASYGIAAKRIKGLE